jgi:hypothetical protein
MPRFYQPDLSQNIDSPFVRDGADKLVRRSYWLDMDDRTLFMVMINGVGANLTNEGKWSHLADIGRGNPSVRSAFRKYRRDRKRLFILLQSRRTGSG